ncbi:MAG: Lrp/AsnC family transcriptional regulator [Verrucomicrobiae bacterium]|nr:Lrp/AsnC family transcriptional regulator [Verrucomicrobiae bacterium]
MDKLLQLLEKDARLSPEQLSQMLAEPEDEVRKRIARYEKEGVLLGYKAMINDDKLDLDRVKAVIEVRITPEREGGFDRTAERMAGFDEVTSCFLMSGGYDVLLFVEAETLHQVASFVASRLATLERVQSTSTHFMLKSYKEQGIIMFDRETESRIAVAP